VGLFAPVRDHIATLVHPSAQRDALTAARHRAFIAPRLLGSLVALAAVPIYLIARGAPSPAELVVFAWLAVPILIAYFLSRTGRYAGAHVLSSFVLTGQRARIKARPLVVPIAIANPAGQSPPKVPLVPDIRWRCRGPTAGR
jgi:hypothetical protein